METKILIIDDEPSFCAVLQRILQEEGHSVLTATTGWEGIVKAKQSHPDLIFLDLNMPVMDGITCLRWLHRTCRASKIVVLTGFGTLKTAKEAQRRGAYDYPAKPFDLKLIRELIQEVARQRGTK